MDFLISGTHINPAYLVAIGFVVGILGGFFGVGGSFLAGPALFALGMPMNFVVGTDLAHIVGKSVVAAKKHRALGNVDIKLGLIMATGTIAGVEAGAQAIQYLKHRASVDVVVGIGFILVLVSISAFIAWESWQTLKMQRKRSAGKPSAPTAGRQMKKDQAVSSRVPRYLKKRSPKPALKKDESVLAHVPKRIHRFNLSPMISLPVSGIERISLWAIISAGYGTITHAVKGNVDIVVALVMHTGAAIGAQIGAAFTEYFHGTRIRLAFAPLPLIGAGLVIYSLLKGHYF
jgi:uncharacterized membrane protein YfcA